MCEGINVAHRPDDGVTYDQDGRHESESEGGESRTTAEGTTTKGGLPAESGAESPEPPRGEPRRREDFRLSRGGGEAGTAAEEGR